MKSEKSVRACPATAPQSFLPSRTIWIIWKVPRIPALSKQLNVLWVIAEKLRKCSHIPPPKRCSWRSRNLPWAMTAKSAETPRSLKMDFILIGLWQKKRNEKVCKKAKGNYTRAGKLCTQIFCLVWQGRLFRSVSIEMGAGRRGPQQGQGGSQSGPQQRFVGSWIFIHFLPFSFFLLINSLIISRIRQSSWE